MCQKLKIILTAAALASTLFLQSRSFAANDINCGISLLENLGWRTTSIAGVPDVSNSNTCQHEQAPYFNTSIQDEALLQQRITDALYSDTSRCLVNRRFRESVGEATKKIINNSKFVFPQPGADPRDPFMPPLANWLPARRRGYDIPSTSLTDGIKALYTKPVVAECAAAIQVAQLASLVEHFGAHTDQFVTPADIGIGVWREFAKSPSIAAHSPLLINRKQRKRALKRLAGLGRGAFYNQSGYISPVKKDIEYIDSMDNRGQNFLITNISERAVQDLRQRNQPLREINKISFATWKNYNQLLGTGLDMEIVTGLMEKNLLATDSFFSDIEVYIHPLRTGTFAKFLARQFKYNPRTAYRFEIYEDYQAGFFFRKYIDAYMAECSADR